MTSKRLCRRAWRDGACGLIAACLGGAPRAESAVLTAPVINGDTVTVRLENAEGAWEIFAWDEGGFWKTVPFEIAAAGAPPGTVLFRIPRAAAGALRGWLRAGSLADPDGDGLPSGREELIFKTNPLLADTNDDGSPDGAGISPVEAMKRTRGHDQYAAAEAIFPDPVEVLVLDAAGRPSPGQAVTFKVTTGGGSVAASRSSLAQADAAVVTPAATVMTDAAGLARAWWKSGKAATKDKRLQRVMAGALAPASAGAPPPRRIVIAEFTSWAGELKFPDAQAELRPPEYAEGSLLDFWPGSNKGAAVISAAPVSGSPASTHPVLLRIDGREAVHFDGADDLMRLDAFAPATGAFTAAIFYRPDDSAAIAPRGASVRFDARLAGRSGQRYLLSSDIAGMAQPPWTLPGRTWTTPPELRFSVWRNYKYFKKVDSFDRTYDEDGSRPTDAVRPPFIATTLQWGNPLAIDNTANGLIKTAEPDGEGGTVEQRPDEARPFSEILKKEILEKELKAKLDEGWEYEHEQYEATLTRYMTQEPQPPVFTAERRNGKPLFTEETYHRMRPVHFDPVISAGAVPAAGTPAKTGWGLSAGANGAAVFDLADAAAPGPAAHLAGYYPGLGAAWQDGSGWRFTVVSRIAKVNKLLTGGPRGTGAGAMIDSTSAATDPPLYIGGQPQLPGASFHGWIAEIYLWSMDELATAQKTELLEDLFLHRLRLQAIATGAAVPDFKDRNANSIPDAWERHLLDAQSRSAFADPDNDGRTNAAEFKDGTDPNGTDSDGDSVPDAAEMAAGSGTFYYLHDSDADGIPDKDDKGENGYADGNLNQIPDGWEAFLAIP